MKKKYTLIAHYVDSTATILSLDCANSAFHAFKECKLHPDLAFAILYSCSLTGVSYRVVDSYVSNEFFHSYEFTLLGFRKH